MPPFFKQQHKYGCSLAVLRMVLAHNGVKVAEAELIDRISKDYGSDFTNVWNPTLAKLACSYEVPTTMHALWPLLKPEVLPKARAEYAKYGREMDVGKYENTDDDDEVTDLLSLSYEEMFRALDLGCGISYEGVSHKAITRELAAGAFVQTSIVLEKLYDNPPVRGMHSILLYSADGEDVLYHDPDRRAGMRCSIGRLIDAASGTGAFMSFMPLNAV